MLDLIVRGGLVVEGTGAAPVTADVGVQGDRVVSVGRLSESARREIDADGALVTPGFVDIHTHFDGQATWDPLLAPSCWHGVTTVAMGNCGVGFAPAHADRHDWLIGLLEGVEDIPGTALAEGLPWGWESFSEYLDVLGSQRRVLDVGAHVPHAAVRTYVMGERGGDPAEVATVEELAAMAELVGRALDAGALGFATSRTEVHRTKAGAFLGTLRAGPDELAAIASALGERNRGVIQLISDCYQSTDPDFVRSELDAIGTLAAASQRPLSFTVQQPYAAPERWRELLDQVARWRRAGLDVRAQVAPRPIGLLLGLEATANPFMLCRSYQEVAQLPTPERAVALATPERRQAVLAEHAEVVAQIPVESLLHQIVGGADVMFVLDDPVDYDFNRDRSVAARASARGEEPFAAVYDALLELEGRRLLYAPLFNFAGGDLGAVREMITSDVSLFGLSDAGAHCGAICDASMTTSYLTLWARDRDDGLSVETVVRNITSATARHVGWHDRGVLAPGYLADVNVIDLEELACAPPRIVYDLPAGGRRLVQEARGYRWTIKSGVPTFSGGVHTGELPGTLVRGETTAPA
jgi:N-acyl-D-aspartate/D-glutamate deacylase